MVRRVLALVVVLAIGGPGTPFTWDASADEKTSDGPAVAHDIYLSLTDASAEAKAAMIAEARRCLAPHPGIIYFATGTLAETKGTFNDRDFDLVIHMVFEDREALATYGRSKLHLEFILKQTGKIKKIRIFDSEIERYESKER